METRKKRLEEHVSRIEGNRNVYRDLVGNPKERSHLEDLDIDGRVILKYFKEMDHIQLAEHRDKWQAVVNAVINLLVQ
jgi:hypothetical protein